MQRVVQPIGRGRRFLEWAAALSWLLPGCAGGAGDLVGGVEPVEWGAPEAREINYIVGETDRAVLHLGFRNRSKKPMQFLESRTDCKCTSIEVPRGEVAPGGSGKVVLTIDIGDGPDHSVISRSMVGYRCGSERYAHVFDAGVNKRRPTEAQPDQVELTSTDDDPASPCEDELTLTQYSKPGREFTLLTNWKLDGDVAVASDSGWGEVRKEGGFIKRSKTLRLRTKPGAITSSGTARLSAACGVAAATLDVPIRWRRPELVKLWPDTVLLRGDRSPSRLHLDGTHGRPKLVDLKLPSGVRAESTPDGGLDNRLVLTLRLDAPDAGSPPSKTESFSATVECGGKSVRVNGTILILQSGDKSGAGGRS